jgi:PUL domain-containing protein
LTKSYFTTDATTPQLLLVARAMTNLLKFSEARQQVSAHHLEHWLRSVELLLRETSVPSVRLSVASLLLNLVYCGRSCGWREESHTLAVRISLQLIDGETDPECFFRALVAVASMVLSLVLSPGRFFSPLLGCSCAPAALHA